MKERIIKIRKFGNKVCCAINGLLLAALAFIMPIYASADEIADPVVVDQGVSLILLAVVGVVIIIAALSVIALVRIKNMNNGENAES